MTHTVTVSDPAMLRTLGWEYPMPSYISATVPVLLRWMNNNKITGAHAHQALAEMILNDLTERAKSHTIEARVARQRDAYKRFKQDQLLDTACTADPTVTSV